MTVCNARCLLHHIHHHGAEPKKRQSVVLMELERGMRRKQAGEKSRRSPDFFDVYAGQRLFLAATYQVTAAGAEYPSFSGEDVEHFHLLSLRRLLTAHEVIDETAGFPDATARVHGPGWLCRHFANLRARTASVWASSGFPGRRNGSGVCKRDRVNPRRTERYRLCRGQERRIRVPMGGRQT